VNSFGEWLIPDAMKIIPTGTAGFVSSVDLTARGHTVFNKFPRALAIIVG
jgi:hypothetical protein